MNLSIWELGFVALTRELQSSVQTLLLQMEFTWGPSSVRLKTFLPAPLEVCQTQTVQPCRQTLLRQNSGQWNCSGFLNYFPVWKPFEDEDFFHCTLSTELSTQVVGGAELYKRVTGKGLELVGKKPAYLIFGKI